MNYYQHSKRKRGQNQALKAHLCWMRVVACVFVLLLSSVLCFGKDIVINILHTTDIHGHMAGRPRSRGSGREDGGGLLRCAALINKIRAEERNVLLVDCGDLIQGSAESFFSRGEIIMQAVAAMRYDALIPGNHEFDWGVENLRRLYGMIEIPVLIANAVSVDGREPVLPNAVPFIVREIEGVRIAIVGLITPHMSRWFRPRFLGELKFQNSVPALRRVMPHVREREPDVIILATHQGHRQWGGDTSANQINSIARAFPDIDLIIGGHTHQDVAMRDVHGVPYTQAGRYGLWLGKIKIVVSGDRREIKSMDFELLRVDESVKPDPVLNKKFETSLNETQEYLSRIVGTADSPHSNKSEFPGQSQTQALIARAIAESVDADVVIHQSLSEYSLRQGPVSMRDIWGIVPYENYIGVAYLTIENLVDILEENSEYLDTRNFKGVHGLVYEIHSGYPKGSRVRNVRLADGRKIGAGERVKVAMNSYDMASSGGRLPILRVIIEQPASRLEETDIDTRNALADYIRRHSPLNEDATAGAIIMTDRP